MACSIGCIKMLLRIAWRKHLVHRSWRRAGGIFIPKEKDSVDVGQFAFSLKKILLLLLWHRDCQATWKRVSLSTSQCRIWHQIQSDRYF